MKKNLFLTRMICLIICGIMMLFCASTIINCEETDTNTVTVAYIDYENMLKQQDDGTYSGYAADYFAEISKYTGWNVKFVDLTWPEAYQQVKNGEIDFYCVARRTESREADFDFSEYSLLNEQMNLYVPQDAEIYYNDFSHFNGMRVGMLKNSDEISYFKQYMTKNNFQAEIVEYDLNTDAETALQNGDVDAVALVGYSVSKDFKTVSNFGVVPSYLMSAQGSKKMVEFNLAQQSIMLDNQNFFNNLIVQYFPLSENTLFTVDEMNYIQRAETINISLIPNRAPINSESKDGNAQGIVPELLSLLAERTGLNFSYDFVPLGTGALDYIEENPDKIIAGVMTDNAAFKKDGLLLSNCFFSSNIILVCRADNNIVVSSKQNLKLAVPTSYVALQNYIKADYPEYEIVVYKTTQECMQAVLDNEVDMMAQNINIVTPLLMNPHYDGLTALPSFFMQEHLSVLCQDTEDNALLISILNKGISSLSETDIEQITVNNTLTNTYHLTFTDMLYKYRITLLVIGILFLFCIVLLMGASSNRRKHYKLISEKNDELALKGSELETKNNALQDAINEAEHANSAKSQFLSRMSHEIRTPMNAIVGLTTIAKSCENEPEKIDNYLNKIDSSSKILLGLINDVLDMSAIESSKLKIANSEFDLKQVLNGLSTIYYPQCKDKGVAFSMGVDLTNEAVKGDSLRVNQILMNLVSNAFKFTPSGGKITITVHEKNRINDTVYICFTVSDTGCGMSDEMMSRLFTPFEQESADTAKKHGGSGLGLSIAKNLVDIMHGAIHVESHVGEGTTFTVDLPFGLTGYDRKIDSEKLKHMRVLIVDDDKSALLYTSVVLERIGVAFDMASSAQEALIMLSDEHQKGSKYDICFVDWKMPGINGVGLTKKIREQYDKDTVVIIISAYDLSEVQDEAENAGADMFITKPLFQSTVFNTMMQLTGGIVKETESKPDKYDFTGHKLLLAEDNELNTEVATAILGMVNMEVVHAENGKQAVEIFENSAPGTYDLILMDIQMPEMDGYEATRIIRASSHPEAKNIPIYAMTANAFTEDIAKALSNGMTGHLSKPIDTEVLYHTLYKVIFEKK